MMWNQSAVPGDKGAGLVVQTATPCWVGHQNLKDEWRMNAFQGLGMGGDAAIKGQHG